MDRRSRVAMIVMPLLGAGFLIYGAPQTWEAWQSASWPKARATLEESKAVEYYGKGGTTFRPHVRYRYTVQDQEHVGTRIQHWTLKFRSRSEADAFLAPYPEGGEVDVAYDPSAPERALLRPGLRWSSAYGTLSGLALILVFTGLAALSRLAGES